MKLIIQIPCYNEEQEIYNTIINLPTKIAGIQKVDILIIDDGSTDETLKICKKIKNINIISLKRNMGLGVAFQKGLDYARENAYDYVINVDADNHFKTEYIPKLYLELIKTNSDIVIGARNISKMMHFSISKKFFHKLGSHVVKLISGIKISDAVSGFRIYNKNAIDKIFVTSNFSYTLDTIIQSQDKNLKISETLIDVNVPTRPSRLFKNIFHFIIKQLLVIVKCFVIYRPFEFFSLLAILPLLVGLIAIIRFLYLYFYYDSSGYIQSIVLGSMSLLFSFLLLALGVIGFLIKDLRKRL